MSKRPPWAHVLGRPNSKPLRRSGRSYPGRICANGRAHWRLCQPQWQTDVRAGSLDQRLF